MPSSQLIGLNFESSNEPVQMPVPSIDGRPIITPSKSPPPLPPRSPLSPTTASIFQPHWPGVSPAGSSTSSVQSTPSLSTQRGTFPTPPEWNWDVSPAEKISSDKYFDTLDPWKHGYIDGDTAVGFMSKSKLPTEDLGRIWYVPEHSILFPPGT